MLGEQPETPFYGDQLDVLLSDDVDGAARGRTGMTIELFADGGDLLGDLGGVLLVLDGSPVVDGERGCGQPVLQHTPLGVCGRLGVLRP